MTGSKRIMIFIDSQNIFMTALNRTPRVKYKVNKLVEFLVNIIPGRELVDAFIYSGIVPPRPNDKIDTVRYNRQRKFLGNLESMDGFQTFIKVTKRKKMSCPHCNGEWWRPIEKGVDVALATDLMLYGLTEQYDVAIVVSGDSDFASVIRKLRSIRPSLRIEIAQFKSAIGSEMVEVANAVHYLDDKVNEIE